MKFGAIIRFLRDFGAILRFGRDSRILVRLSDFGTIIRFWRDYPILARLSDFGPIIRFWCDSMIFWRIFDFVAIFRFFFCDFQILLLVLLFDICDNQIWWETTINMVGRTPIKYEINDVSKIKTKTLPQSVVIWVGPKPIRRAFGPWRVRSCHHPLSHVSLVRACACV